jgi:hypothetical protein
MKQETIEEAAERFFKIHEEGPWFYTPIREREGFVAGAKWQKERSYNEEDMMFAYEQGARLALISQSPLALHKGEFPNPKEWFEQFKNK